MFSTVYSRAGIQFLFCAFCSIVVGFLDGGTDIFRLHMTSFQFVFSGIFVGLIVGARHFLPLPRTALVAAGIYLLVLWVNKVEDPDRRASMAIYISVLYLGTAGGLLTERYFPKLRFGKVVVWSAVFGVLHGVSVPVLGPVFSHDPTPGMAMYAARIGAMIGMAAGFGYELANLAGAVRLPINRPPPKNVDIYSNPYPFPGIPFIVPGAVPVMNGGAGPLFVLPNESGNPQEQSEGLRRGHPDSFGRTNKGLTPVT